MSIYAFRNPSSFLVCFAQTPFLSLLHHPRWPHLVKAFLILLRSQKEKKDKDALSPFKNTAYNFHIQFSFICLPAGSAGEESACNVGEMDLIPRLRRSPGEGNSYPRQYSGLENSMDYSPWGCKELDMAEQTSLSLFF